MADSNLINTLGQGRQNLDQANAKLQMKDIAARASEAFRGGDYAGALSSLAEANPGVLENPSFQLLKQKLTPPEPETFGGEFEAVNPDSGLPEVYLRGNRGTVKPTNLGGAPKAGKPLAGEAQRAIADSAKSVEGMRRMGQLFEGLLKGKQVGPIPGSFEALKQKIGVADPLSNEFQNLKSFLALGIAAEENKGRPSEKDMEAAEKILTSIQVNPAAGFSQLVSMTSNLEDNQANTFLDAINFNPGSEDQIRAAAKQRGLDLELQQRIIRGAQITGYGTRDFRRNLKLLQAVQSKPEFKKLVLSDPILKEELQGFVDVLDASGISPKKLGF